VTDVHRQAIAPFLYTGNTAVTIFKVTHDILMIRLYKIFDIDLMVTDYRIHTFQFPSSK